MILLTKAYKLILNGRDLTSFNDSIVHETKKTSLYREMMNYIDLLANQWNFSRIVTDESRHIINELQKHYAHKDIFNKLRFESVCMACVIIAHHNCKYIFNCDILNYISVAFKPVDHILIIRQVSRMYLTLLDFFDYPENFNGILPLNIINH